MSRVRRRGTRYEHPIPQSAYCTKIELNAKTQSQTYLRLSSLPYRAVPSSNHSSPSGALPFLIAPENSETIPSNKLMQWIKKHGNPPEEDLEDPEIKALLALVETKLRDAWVCSICSTRWAGCTKLLRASPRLSAWTPLVCTPLRVTPPNYPSSHRVSPFRPHVCLPLIPSLTITPFPAAMYCFLS